mgnify:CR=1 FL=1
MIRCVLSTAIVPPLSFSSEKSGAWEGEVEAGMCVPAADVPADPLLPHASNPMMSASTMTLMRIVLFILEVIEERVVMDK